jgi:GH15 family glucan-1,4-alpha-glucosidase
VRPASEKERVNPLPIESYALIGDMRSAALVSLEGSIDWLAWPRFDSGSCFTALLGTPDDGRWVLAPVQEFTSKRRYRGDTLVLETTFSTTSGRARVVDCMAILDEQRHLMRLVEGLEGEVEFEGVFAPRFDYGSIAPWLTVRDDHAIAIGGPDALVLRSDAVLTQVDRAVHSRFSVKPDEQVAFKVLYFPSHLPVPEGKDVPDAIHRTQRRWEEWAARCTYDGPYRDAVMRSLIVLKALTYAPTGGIIAAPTTSLPEELGGVRNWDYRYCWLRDSTFTLLALKNAGFHEEAAGFAGWLLRAVAGDPADLQIMYGVAGERRLDERTLPWLSGYGGAQPVRIGNAAYQQFQLDVLGEVGDALWQVLRSRLHFDPTLKAVLHDVIDYIHKSCRSGRDRGMWEVRGRPRHFTESKAMAWSALDRVVKGIEEGQFEGPLEEWRAERDALYAQILRRGYDSERNTFTQSYGHPELDASLLLLPQIGFLPPDDPRIAGTVAAIEKELAQGPFVKRYSTTAGDKNTDGLPGGEGAFLACTFWLADYYALVGRYDEATALFEQVLALRNDVGLLSEEYDIERKRLVGNFPQAFSHLALVNTAHNLTLREGPARQRSGQAPPP